MFLNSSVESDVGGTADYDCAISIWPGGMIELAHFCFKVAQILLGVLYELINCAHGPWA